MRMQGLQQLFAIATYKYISRGAGPSIRTSPTPCSLRSNGVLVLYRNCYISRNKDETHIYIYAHFSIDSNVGLVGEEKTHFFRPDNLEIRRYMVTLDMHGGSIHPLNRSERTINQSDGK